MTKVSFKQAVLAADGVALVLALLVAWRLEGSDGAIAALIGNLAGLANVGALAWLVSRLIGAASRGAKSAYGALLAGKLVLFMATLGLLALALRLSPLSLVIGFTGLVVSLFVAGAVAGLDNASRDSQPLAPPTGPIKETSAR